MSIIEQLSKLNLFPTFKFDKSDNFSFGKYSTARGISSSMVTSRHFLPCFFDSSINPHFPTSAMLPEPERVFALTLSAKGSLCSSLNSENDSLIDGKDQSAANARLDIPKQIGRAIIPAFLMMSGVMLVPFFFLL